MNLTQESKIGFIGLGSMGMPMARHLVADGFSVIAHDQRKSRVQELVDEGAESAVDARQAASGSSVVCLSLPGPPEVEQVLWGDDGILDELAEGTYLVSFATISPELAENIAEAASMRSVHFVDAPVTGAADGAAAGTLTFMVGAEESVFAACQPMFDVLGSQALHTGKVGTGSATKLITNMLWFINIVALGDALVMGERAGVPRDVMSTIIPHSAGASWAAGHDMPAILRGDTDKSFTLALCNKDLRLIRGLAEHVGVTMNMVAPAIDQFEEAERVFGPEEGELAVVSLTTEAHRPPIEKLGPDHSGEDEAEQKARP